ncbi:hypothetical protein GIB67_022518 [Kingdonia uniflora]|uniref:Uncharacterized protein n=1 Tax=Kingdonia uniflora TaxID=39325 RepID=A0A7J7L7E6_9MAGN|nr:hypothetical protein GIB67_022518 [Kingdonia uniflora]
MSTVKILKAYTSKRRHDREEKKRSKEKEGDDDLEEYFDGFYGSIDYYHIWKQLYIFLSLLDEDSTEDT